MSTIGGNWKEMFSAAGSGDVELLKYHLKNGVDLNYQHPEVLTTFLIEASQKGQLEIVKVLLENGADPLIKSQLDSWTALQVAEKFKQNEIVVELRKVMGLPQVEQETGLFSKFKGLLGITPSPQ